MLEIISLLGLGFLLGLEHSLDADHLAAISTISSTTSTFKKALIAGLYWGVGHTSILLITGLIVLSSHRIIPGKIASIFEILVGFMLIFLGIKNIFGFKKDLLHTHEDGSMHAHPHLKKHERIHHHKSFWIGIVHGLAGSAALMLLILTTIKSAIIGLLYIAIFGAGTICSMSLMSILMSTPSILFQKKFPDIQKRLPVITGVISIFIGINHIIS